jgi:hypothetical protein
MADYPGTYPKDDKTRLRTGDAVIEAYGRLNGSVKYHYGPRRFDSSWGGAFTALQVAQMLQRQKTKKATKTSPAKAGTIAEARNLEAWLERLQTSFVSQRAPDQMMISGVKERLFLVDRVLPSQLISFTAPGTDPATQVAGALERMELGRWGVVKELCLVLDGFDGVPGTGIRGMTVFITI